jgi:Zn-dependent peptidase ImmA (M78 family)/transcriptional regulator with XRE-family HTH domain
MAVTQAEVGRRVRAAREACRLTQDQVAEVLGLSRSSVAQVELGNRPISSIELDRLAYHLGRDVREFLRGDLRESDPLVALFRVQPEVAGQPEVVEGLRRCMALAREITNLEQQLRIERAGAVANYPMGAARGKWDAVQQGMRVAGEERRRLGLGWTPASDLVEILEVQGVRTAVIDLPEDVSGLTINDPVVGILVVANRRHPSLRRRFSFAHEYGHVLLDRARLSSVSRGEDGEQFVEVRANAFAASFLMPEDGVLEFVAGLGKGRPSRGVAEVFGDGSQVVAEGRETPGSQDVQIYDLVHLAHHFGVSRLAALFRLKNMKLVSQGEFDRLRALDASGAGAQVARLLDLPEADHGRAREDFTHRFLSLGLEAFRRELISHSKLRELASLVGVAPADFRDLVTQAGLDSTVQ